MAQQQELSLSQRVGGSSSFLASPVYCKVAKLREGRSSMSDDARVPDPPPESDNRFCCVYGDEPNNDTCFPVADKQSSRRGKDVSFGE